MSITVSSKAFNKGREHMKTNQTTDPERVAYTIMEFCRRHSISRSSFYAMEKAGSGPRTFCIGGRGKGRRISLEASEEWRRGLEAEEESKSAA